MSRTDKNRKRISVLGNWKRPSLMAVDQRPARDRLTVHALSELAAHGSVRCPLEAACLADDEAGR